MTRSIHAAAIIAVVILFFCLSMLAQALAPSSLNYQGYLTDASGSPIDGDVVVTFSIYTTDSGGTFMWTDTELITVDQGLFSVELGGPASPFPPGMFDTVLWLGVAVNPDPEMLPRRPLTTVAFSFKSDDTLSLQGQGPAAFDQSSHVVDTANPHAVTIAQTGGATAGDIADLQAQLDAALTVIAQLQTDLAAEVANRVADVDAEEVARINALAAEIIDRIEGDAALDTTISSIQANTVLALDGVLSLPDAETALFSGVNLQVVNGTGTTDGLPTGTGNLLIGYNVEEPFGDPICSLGAYTNPDDCANQGGVWAVIHKSGSHNVVIGDGHNYSRSAGLVAGSGNDITGDFATVTAGVANIASGSFASVSGGSGNTASGYSSSVSGGADNTASGNSSSVSGGENNIAKMVATSVSGGNNNTADENWSSISGGVGNATTGEYASISGGFNNSASGFIASALGGENNVASGSRATVVGGGGPAVEDGGEAAAEYSAIVGRQYAIGDTGPAGGLVFYVSDDGRHGLEAAPDYAVGLWGCYETITGAYGLVVGHGEQNTAAIFARDCPEDNIAAELASNYSLNGYEDWFLPSRDELNLMYVNLHNAGLGDFNDFGHWSSSEINSDSAVYINFFNGDQFVTNKGLSSWVRAARAF